MSHPYRPCGASAQTAQEEIISFSTITTSLTAAITGLALTLLGAGPVTASAVAQRSGAHPARTAASCPSRWVGSWYAAPSDASDSQPLADQTLRMVIAPHHAGTTARIHLSNQFGTTPVTLGPVSVGIQSHGPELVAGSRRMVRFNGAPTVTIPAGSEVVSDPVGFTIRPFVDLAVSVYVAGPVPNPTEHFTTRQTNYLTPAGGGDQTAKTSGAAFTKTATNLFINGWYFLDGVDVQAPGSTGAVVAVGDSITDGVQARGGGAGIPAEDTQNAGTNSRWPDFLTRRLNAAGIPLSVLNSGINGNRLLQDGQLPQYGPKGLSRFQLDALSLAGVTDVILALGANDTGQQPGTTAQQIIGGYQQLIAQAHVAGIRIQLATLTPYANSTTEFFGTAAAQATRAAVNAWIRSQHLSDGIVDFDAAVHDPSHPDIIAPQYDDGDHLHYNPAGYQALANAVPLNELTPTDRGCA